MGGDDFNKSDVEDEINAFNLRRIANEVRENFSSTRTDISESLLSSILYYLQEQANKGLMEAKIFLRGESHVLDRELTLISKLEAIGFEAKSIGSWVEGRKVEVEEHELRTTPIYTLENTLTRRSHGDVRAWIISWGWNRVRE